MTLKHLRPALASALSLALTATLASAQESNTDPVSIDTEADDGTSNRAPSLWTAGLFFVAADHAVYPGAERRSTNAVMLPFFTWRGPLLRVESGAAGLRALRTPRTELDFGVAASFGSNGTDSGARAGMPAIGTLVEIGPSLRINLGELPEDGTRPPWRLDLPLRAAFDASRDLDFAGVSFEPRLSWRLDKVGGWTPSVYATLLFGDRKLNAMYYEVDPVYATPTRPAYEAHAGLVATRVGTSWTRMLGRDWRLGLHASLESVRGAANAGSPVVDRMVDPTVAVSLTWTAFRSEEAGVK